MDSYQCHRCSVNCVLEPMYEGSKSMGWYCPCCRSRTRTTDLIQADAERRAAEKNITVEELYEESWASINPAPLSEKELEGIRQFAAQRAKEWKPTCKHDTVNPWLPSQS